MTLVDGTVVSSDSVEWRIECLARHVLALGSRKAIDDWLAAFAAKHPRTPEAEGNLRARMNAIRAVTRAVRK